MKKKITTSLFVLFLLASANAQLFEQERELGSFPQIQSSQSFFPLPRGILSSSIEPLRVNDPFAAQGQPVIIEFTLSNIGDQYGYPFNTIALSPNSYGLVMMVDNQYDRVLLPNGRTIDVWSRMNAWEQFAYALALSTDAFVSEVTGTVEGRGCKYVDVWTHMPKHIQDFITQENDGKKPRALYMWDCIRITDEQLFNDKVMRFCEGTIDQSCLAEINQRTYVGSSLVVALTNTMPKGQCGRPSEKGFWEKLGAAVLDRTGYIECGIGENGIQPRESVTFTFIGLVPQDAPVVPPKDFIELSEINAGVTQSASCANSEFPEACHAIYAGVYPLAKDNLIKAIVDGVVGNLASGFNMIIGTLFNMDLEFAHDAALTSGGITSQVVGRPIWEGRGIFYIVGAALKGELTLIIYAAFLVSLGLSYAGIKRRTGAG